MLRRVAPILAKNRWKRLAAPHRLVVVAVVMVVTVVFIMAVIMVVMMVMTVIMVPIHMVMIVVVLMMVQPLARPRPARILVEHQRFDGDRHGIGRHADAAEIDVIEVPQDDTVDHQHLALDVQFVAQDMTERLRHVRRA